MIKLLDFHKSKNIGSAWLQENTGVIFILDQLNLQKKSLLVAN
jgi:hypothetical protein